MKEEKVQNKQSEQEKAFGLLKTTMFQNKDSKEKIEYSGWKLQKIVYNGRWKDMKEKVRKSHIQQKNRGKEIIKK